MSPWEYQEIRVALGHGSGFDSPGFRNLARVTPAPGGAFDRALDAPGARAGRVLSRGREFEELYQVAER